jgi:sulfatase modifying factor 1
VPGGTFPQGRSEVPGASDYYPGVPPEVPEFSSTVSSFALDKYEVTVGRFRKFVNAYVSNLASAPADGAGANPNVPGSGWQSAWNTSLPAAQATFADPTHLHCYSAYETWTDTAGANENKAINCVDWYEAFAFCIWDGGRLPTESEWEYTAAGGAENRLFPWGSATPDCTRVNFSGCSGTVVAVGSKPMGNGRWGHADLAGNVFEWALDWMDTYPTSASINYADISSSTRDRVIRGGDVTSWELQERAAYRLFYRPGEPGYSDVSVGLRCARIPQ